MKIHELAGRSGLTADTIRYYEREGLLDHRHVARDRNNYRSYTEEAVARLTLIKKLQSVGFSLAELRETLDESGPGGPDNDRVVEQIRRKIEEIKRKRQEFDQILGTLTWMLDYRIAMVDDPQRAEALLRQRYAGKGAHSAGAGAADVARSSEVTSAKG